MTNTPDIVYALKQSKSKNKISQNAGVHYLICKYEPLIHKLITQICPTCCMQDMMQAGRMGILKAINSYNGSSGFGTWVYMQIRNELQLQREIEFPVKISRFLLKKGNKATFTTIQEESMTEDPIQILIQKEDSQRVTNALRHINRMFSKKYCKIFTSYYFLQIPLVKLSKQYQVNANEIVRKMLLAIRNGIK